MVDLKSDDSSSITAAVSSALSFPSPQIHSWANKSIHGVCRKISDIVLKTTIFTIHHHLPYEICSPLIAWGGGGVEEGGGYPAPDPSTLYAPARKLMP